MLLKQMAGKVEFGLKVTWHRDHIVEELQREHEEIHRFHQEITRKHLQSTYFARMQLGRMIDKALEERSGEYVREIYETLRCHLRSLARQQTDRRQDDHECGLPAGARAGKPSSTRQSIALRRKFGERLNFKYTGPWPRTTS